MVFELELKICALLIRTMLLGVRGKNGLKSFAFDGIYLDVKFKVNVYKHLNGNGILAFGVLDLKKRILTYLIFSSVIKS